MTKKTWRDTVFNPAKKFAHENERIALVYHRSTVVIYAMLMAWSIASLNLSFPALLSGDVTAFTDWFSIYVIPASLLAMIGALYFPRLARLEMFASSALLGLVSVFLVLIAWEAMTGDDSARRNLWIDLALAVIPTSRVILIFRSLLRAADQEDKE